MAEVSQLLLLPVLEDTSRYCAAKHVVLPGIPAKHT